MKHLVIHDIKEIGSILDYVHDRSFEIEEISFDKAKQILSIPLTVISEESEIVRKILFLKITAHPVLKAELLIYSTVDYTLTDDAQIGRGNINIIESKEGTVVVRCGIPVTIRVQVSEFHVELIISDQVVGKKRGLRWR
jgi:hypothetical protein